MEGSFQIAVLDRGFVYAGNCTLGEEWLTITNARNVRRWGTTNGLGQLALEGPTASTKLDPVGVVKVPLRAVITLLDVSQEAQAKWNAS